MERNLLLIIGDGAIVGDGSIVGVVGDGVVCGVEIYSVSVAINAVDCAVSE